jgi:hypothetical protein
LLNEKALYKIIISYISPICVKLVEPVGYDLLRKLLISFNVCKKSYEIWC